MENQRKTIRNFAAAVVFFSLTSGALFAGEPKPIIIKSECIDGKLHVTTIDGNGIKVTTNTGKDCTASEGEKCAR